MNQLKEKMLKMLRKAKEQRTLNKARNNVLNNAGMTLVEVIISMTILSVVVVAVLQSLTMAMVYNGKARKRQDATFKSEAVMEVFKGYNVGELYEMFTVSATPDPDPVAEALRAKRAASFEGLKDIIGSGGTYTVSGIDPEIDPDATLTFDIKNIEIKSVDGGTGEKYDVQVVATPAHQPLYALPKYDSAKDIVFESLEKYDTEARKKAFDDFKKKDDAGNYVYITDFLDDLQNRPENLDPTGKTLVCDGNGEDLDVDKIIASLKEENVALKERVTTFTVDDTGVKVKMVYRYDIRGYMYYRKEYPEEVEDDYDPPAPTPDPDPADPDPDPDPDSDPDPGSHAIAGEIKYAKYSPATAMEYEVELDGTHPDDDENAIVLGHTNLEKVYIYYYPQYAKWNDIDEDGNVASSTQIEDIIEIDNKKSSTIKCCLMKQKPGTMSEIKASVLDGAYSPKVGLVSGSGSVELYHNLNDNIGKKPEIGKGSSESITTAAGIPGVSGFANKVKLDDGSEIAASGGEGYMSLDAKVDSPVGYQLKLTVTKQNEDGSPGQLVSEIVSSSNER